MSSTTARSSSNLPICANCSRLYDVRIEHQGHVAECRFCDAESEPASTSARNSTFGVGEPVVSLDEEIIALTAAGLTSNLIAERLGVASAGAVRVRRLRHQRRVARVTGSGASSG